MLTLFSPLQECQPEIPAAIRQLYRWAQGATEINVEGASKSTIALHHVQELRDKRKRKAELPLQKGKVAKPDDPPSQVFQPVFLVACP